jgi:hypothetical protein
MSQQNPQTWNGDVVAMSKIKRGYIHALNGIRIRNPSLGQRPCPQEQVKISAGVHSAGIVSAY